MRSKRLSVRTPEGMFKALIGSLPHLGTVRWRQGTRIGYVPQKLDIERDFPITGRDLDGMFAIAVGVAVTATVSGQ